MSYYRLILGHRSLVFGDSLQARTDDFKYQDKELSDALIQGRIDEAKEALSDIIRKASQYSLTTLNSVLIRLLLSIRSTVELLEANHAITVRFNINIYLSKLSKIETLEMNLADFYHLFDDLALQLESKKENKYSDLFDNVMQFIHMEFANPSLTLDTIAQKVNLSPNYLAKLFKNYHLISMNDYINDVRLQCASDLIITTDETITAIMEKSGFSTRSTFSRFSKRSTVYHLINIEASPDCRRKDSGIVCRQSDCRIFICGTRLCLQTRTRKSTIYTEPLVRMYGRAQRSGLMYM